MKVINEMEMKFKAISQNESFARACVSGFCLNTGLTVEELTDIKTAVSEAVTNSVVHAYPNGKSGNVYMKVTIFENYVSIEIKDEGVGIDNIDKATKKTMLDIVRDEMKVVQTLIKLRLQDSRIGFESSNQYFYTLQDLKEKMINLAYCEEGLQ